MKQIVIYIFCFLLYLPTIAQTKTKADELYGKEKYEEAAKLYERILDKEGVAAEVYYNLGNCYYKMDEIPRAVLNYERALLLSPGDGDIRANLVLARSKTIDKSTPPSEMFFVTWWKSLVNSMSMTAWTVIAIISFVLLLVGILMYFFMSSLTLRKTGVYGSIVMLVVVVLANIAAYSQNDLLLNRNTAIVMEAAVSVKSSPSDGSTDLFVIHEGSKVQILDNSMKGWVEVKFEEGKQGWVPKSSVEVI
ncbi:MAG: tetratricopeptide repeat protein [Bacteroidaceae bacterium]|nr:tetratricopeptide repeat protein [Bacteroidaceae bacterium]